MFVALIAIVLLLTCVGVIYLLLRNMGREGIEVAAPTSCKAGRCGVDAKAARRNEEVSSAETVGLIESDVRPEPVAAEDRPRHIA